MSRESYDLSVADKANSPLAKKLRELIPDAKAANALREYLGCSPQAISQYKLGTSLPKTENLIKIADYFGISVDYLLGRTETRSRSEDIQVTAKTTGLSEKSVKSLQSITKILGRAQNGFTCADALNNLICNEKFMSFVIAFWDFECKSEDFNDNKEQFIRNYMIQNGNKPENLMESVAKAVIEDDSTLTLYTSGTCTKDSYEAMQFSFFKLQNALHSIVSAEQKEV